MSLLTIVQDAMSICGLTSTSSAFGTSDPTSAQFVALAQVEGDELSRFADWRGLKALISFTGNGSLTLWDLPEDFDRFMPGHILWSDQGAGEVLQHVTDQELVALKSQQTDPPTPVWRLFGDQMEIWPAIDDGETITTEYRSEFWILGNDGSTRKARWSADSDRAIIPERLMTLGVVWRWKQAKGFDYSEAFRSYQFERAKQAGSDGGRPIIHISESTKGDITKMGRPAYYTVIP